MDSADLDAYAKALSEAIGSLRPWSRDELVVVLRGLELSAGDADRVIARGLALGLLEVDPQDPSRLRAKT